MRSLSLTWITFCIETSNKATVLKVHKDYVPIFMEVSASMSRVLFVFWFCYKLKYFGPSYWIASGLCAPLVFINRSFRCSLPKFGSTIWGVSIEVLLKQYIMYNCDHKGWSGFVLCWTLFWIIWLERKHRILGLISSFGLLYGDPVQNSLKIFQFLGIYVWVFYYSWRSLVLIYICIVFPLQ